MDCRVPKTTKHLIDMDWAHHSDINNLLESREFEQNNDDTEIRSLFSMESKWQRNAKWNLDSREIRSLVYFFIIKLKSFNSKQIIWSSIMSVKSRFWFFFSPLLFFNLKFLPKFPTKFQRGLRLACQGGNTSSLLVETTSFWILH